MERPELTAAMSGQSRHGIPAGVDGVITVLDDLLPIIDVLPVEAAVHASAQHRYRASLPSGTSFVDQVSFGVMAQASIQTAFALDADFSTAGVSVVPAP